jgi:tripartite-type tricarboxylate transporter receptor subunit TctC
VHLIVGFAAGGPLDTGARLIAQALEERLHQSFIVENHAGASGNVAAAEVARANPDGYTLLVCAAANAWNVSLYKNLSFDFVRDIAPVASINRAGGIMLVSLSLAVETLPDFIAYAKANPGKINMASAGPGSAPGMWGELFKYMAGVDLVTVNYRGSAPAMPDLFAGRVQVLFEPAITAIGPALAGKVRALGVTNATRIVQLPDVPAIGEYVPGYVATGWQAICAPKNTPPQNHRNPKQRSKRRSRRPRVQGAPDDVGRGAVCEFPCRIRQVCRRIYG